MEGLSTELALVIVGGALLVGLVAVAVALFQQAGASRRIVQVLDDLRHGLQVLMDNQVHEAGQRLELRRRALALTEKDREAGVVVRMRGTLTLLEDSQEFKAGYFVLVMGSRQVLVEKIRAKLVNARDPDLSVTLDAQASVVLDPGVPLDGEVTVSVRDLARVNLPFVPEFKYLRESCRLVVSVQFAERDGEERVVERDLLER